ncbi:Retrovirus-related Pol polyprotein, partial [Biomphalaria pfeifferi]
MAESLFKPPINLNITEANISENFRKRKWLIEVYVAASGANTKPKEQQAAIILT